MTKVDEKALWPARLTLRDTKVVADEGQRIFTTATGYGYAKQDYVRADLAYEAAKSPTPEPAGDVREAAADTKGWGSICDRPVARAIWEVMEQELGFDERFGITGLIEACLLAADDIAALSAPASAKAAPGSGVAAWRQRFKSGPWTYHHADWPHAKSERAAGAIVEPLYASPSPPETREGVIRGAYDSAMEMLAGRTQSADRLSPEQREVVSNWDGPEIVGRTSNVHPQEEDVSAAAIRARGQS